MKKILEWIRRDGILHIDTCAFLAIAVSLFFPWWVGGLVALTAGVGKEIWDMKHDGVASWHDVICDLIGTAIGIAITLLAAMVR